VLARDDTIGPRGPFIAISSPVVIHLGLATIWLGKLVSGTLCFWGAAQMWGARTASADAFNAAKTPGLVGCGVAILMLFGAFVTVGGVYFFMWQSAAGQLSQTFAMGYIASIGMVALFVN
jgi:predicted small integral membrane protein